MGSRVHKGSMEYFREKSLFGSNLVSFCFIKTLEDQIRKIRNHDNNHKYFILKYSIYLSILIVEKSS